MPLNLRNEAAKRRELAVQLRLALSLERALRVRLRKELSRVANVAASKLRAGGQASIDGKHVANLSKMLFAHYVATAKLYGQRVRGAAKQEIYAIETKELSDDVFSEEVRRFASQQTAQRVTKIADTTRQQIQDVVGRGVDQGLGMADIANMIEEHTGGTIAGSRADLIARTETHMASQRGSLLAAESLEMPMLKEWISAEDERTRETHSAANGQKVKMNEKFKVGNSYLEHPGDPNGEAGEVINCRCAMVFAVDDSAMQDEGESVLQQPRQEPVQVRQQYAVETLKDITTMTEEQRAPYVAKTKYKDALPPGFKNIKEWEKEATRKLGNVMQDEAAKKHLEEYFRGSAGAIRQYEAMTPEMRAIEAERRATEILQIQPDAEPELLARRRALEADYIEAAQDMDRIFGMIEPTEATVYRGQGNLTKDKLLELLNAETIEFGGSTSTTLNASTAKGFANSFIGDDKYAVIMRIKSKSGRAIQTISHYKYESELIMPKGAKLRQVGSPQRLGDDKKLSRFYVVDFEEI